MTDGGIKMGMTTPTPGAFIRVETHEESEFSVSGAARIPGVRRRDRRSAASVGMIVALREIFFIVAKCGQRVPERACCGQAVDSMQEIA